MPIADLVKGVDYAFVTGGVMACNRTKVSSVVFPGKYLVPKTSSRSDGRVHGRAANELSRHARIGRWHRKQEETTSAAACSRGPSARRGS